mmetsp:Transcript_43198/g.102007  ORF Transcript_43198/g.102007 Transcript_43198/m.102007 type:complete len:497 (+) Transcript_43198:176-1666(+)
MMSTRTLLGAVLVCSMVWNCAAFLPLSLGRINVAARTQDSFCSISGRVASSRPGRSAGLQSLRCAEEAVTPPRRRTGRGNKICILGGGFGGVYTALKLAALAPLEDPKAEITLVDASERFVFLPLLYELVTGELQDWEVAPVFTDVLKGSGVKFVHGSVLGVDKDSRTVSVQKASVAGGGETTVEFDKLVVALGQEPSLPEAGRIKELALPFARVQHAHTLRTRLRHLSLKRAAAAARGAGGKASIAVVGGGYSGVELACSLAETHKSWAEVKLFQRSDNVLPGATRYGRTTSRQEMQARGVTLMTHSAILSLDEESLTYKKTEGGEEHTEPAHIVVWTGGMQANSVVGSALGFKTNEQGRLPVDLFLRVRGEEGVYALGDIADSTDHLGDAVPRTAAAALQQSETLAWNLHASLTYGVPVKFRYQDLGEMMTHGAGGASVASAVFGLKASGPLAAAIRRATYLLRMPGLQHKAQVAGSWARRLPSDLQKILQRPQ